MKVIGEENMKYGRKLNLMPDLGSMFKATGKGNETV